MSPLSYVPMMTLADAHRAAYAEASPFPHVVLDNVFPPETLDHILDEFPRPEEKSWYRFANQEELKLGTEGDVAFGPETSAFLRELNSSRFIRFLERLTSIQGLIPDPHFVGGGLHQIQRGGFLKIHADFNVQPELKLDRRLNLLLYLNKDWRDEFGGHLELWDRRMTRCEAKVLPVFNRMVVFSTTDDAFHGHPEPLTCPEGWTRKSVALYYYTNGRPAAERSDVHTTLFQTRPGEATPDLRGKAKRLVKSLVPPLALDVYRSLRGN